MTTVDRSSVGGIFKHLPVLFWSGWAAALLLPLAVLAQEEALLQPGEAYVTRFSGTLLENGRTVIDTEGTVGSIFDLREPSMPPKGEHWASEPQRQPVSAAEVGQVFGVALDDANPPNIFLTATAAFGLHRTSDNSDWMAGMWGEGGGPGTLWRLNRDKGYLPESFADISLEGRPNSGAALGNVTFDRWNHQFYVSDLESGMIHRIRQADGVTLGHYDHGISGRVRFLDAETGTNQALPETPFDPDSHAQITDCAAGPFAQHPECWNLADYRRRVWGVGVRRSEQGEVRLYYATWSSEALGSKEFPGPESEDARNAIWSVAINEQGDFNVESVRREFLLPDFFTQPADIGRAGRSRPVSDIAFPKCSEQDLMLLSERGGLRNLGLDQEQPFATPHESRQLLYRLNEHGVWVFHGRYDVGNYDRRAEGQPFLRANSSGGCDFGYAYTKDWVVDETKPDQFVWSSGDALCSAAAPCFSSGSGKKDDSSEVHGIQGASVDLDDELMPAGALRPYPDNGSPYPAKAPDQAYLIDSDINLDADFNVIEEEFVRNDATRPGDVEIYAPCKPETAFIAPVHPRAVSHPASRSHPKRYSHPRYRSHPSQVSHPRERSHPRRHSHPEAQSHPRYRSHPERRSHPQGRSHPQRRSHPERRSHATQRSHPRTQSHPEQRSHPTVRSGPQTHPERRSHPTARSNPQTHPERRSHPMARSNPQTHPEQRSHPSSRSHPRSRSLQALQSTIQRIPLREHGPMLKPGIYAR